MNPVTRKSNAAAVTATLAPTMAKQSGLIDKDLQAKLLGMLRTKGKPIYFSEFRQRTQLAPADIEANLNDLVDRNFISKTGKIYTLIEQKVIDFDDDQLHMLAALNSTSQKSDKEIFTALSIKVKGVPKPDVKDSQVIEVNEILMDLVLDGFLKVDSTKKLFTLTESGKAFVESWHAAGGSKFKALKYWD